MISSEQLVSTKQNKVKTVLKVIKKDWLAWLIMLPSLFLFLIFQWGPLIEGVVLSFFRTKGFKAVRFVGFENYKDIISNSAFQQTLKNTFVYVMWSILLGFILPIIVAVIINEMHHLQSFFKFSVYFPQMVPGIAAALLWYYMFDPSKNGLLNMLLSSMGLPPSQWLQNPKLTIMLIIITMTWRGFGGTVIIYLASLQGVNTELYEAASIDGAGIWRKFINITIPQIKSIISIMAVLQIIGVFQVMYEPMTMTGGGPNNASSSLMLQSYNYAFTYFQADKSMTVGVITFLILLVFTMIYYKLDKRDE